jgi:hypothetical protein
MTESLRQEVGDQSEGELWSVDRRAALERSIVVARWREAEATIYQLIMSEPTMYEAAVRAVGLISARLRSASDQRADIVALSESDILELVTADPRTAEALCASPLDIRLLFDAARAQTYALLPDPSSSNSSTDNPSTTCPGEVA